jgi:fucose permease
MPAVSQITLASAFSGAAYSVYLVNAPTALMELGGMSTGQFALIVSFQGAALLTGRVLNRALLSTLNARRVFPVALWGNLFLAIVALLGARLGADLWMAIAPVLLMILIFPMITSNGLALAQDGDRTAPGGVASIFGASSAAIGGVSASIVGAWGADAVAVGFGMVLVSALALAFVRSER